MNVIKVCEGSIVKPKGFTERGGLLDFGVDNVVVGFFRAL